MRNGAAGKSWNEAAAAAKETVQIARKRGVKRCSREAATVGGRGGDCSREGCYPRVMFDNILVPVDFAPKNHGALAVACELAGQGRITLLHVIERIDSDGSERSDGSDVSARPGSAVDHAGGEGDEELDRFYERLEERSRERMDEMLAELGAGLGGSHVATRIVYGHRARTIVDTAAELDCDLIVMSSHRVQSVRPAADWISISHKVAILAGCPILLIK